LFDLIKQEELFQVESKPERPTSFSQLLINRHRFPFDMIAWEKLQQQITVTTVLC
jgi:hypothetical protein